MLTPLHRECRETINALRALADALEAELRRTTARPADPQADPPARPDRPNR